MLSAFDQSSRGHALLLVLPTPGKDASRTSPGVRCSQAGTMSSPNETLVYELFLAARERAMTLTDQYNETPPADPARPALWGAVVGQTEAARLLLEYWLRGDAQPDHPAVPASKDVSAGQKPSIFVGV
jgi:hypothetical protein